MARLVILGVGPKTRIGSHSISSSQTDQREGRVAEKTSSNDGFSDGIEESICDGL